KETTSEFYDFNVVLNQTPKAGSRVPKGSKVNITLNVEDKGQ
ncbi:MAG: PASTA domain-containing protein, partial [Endomicrobiales bacterium]|nr:PASTA domain-containing protein [Endomicrobiales bacterium]